MQHKNIIKNNGLKEGREEGIKEGKKEEKIEIVQKLLEEKMPIEFIEKITGLSKQEIHVIKEKI